MFTSLKIAGGVLILAGGIYVVSKTKIFQKMGEGLSNTGSKIKESFVEGYTEVVKTAWKDAARFFKESPMKDKWSQYSVPRTV